MYSKDQVDIEAWVRKGSANQIRNRATSVRSLEDERWGAEWDLIAYQSDSLESAMKEALWFSDVLVIRTPQNLRELVIAGLQKAKVNHG
jgi:hypothetical protein